MGYDFRYLRQPEGEAERVAAARDAANKAWNYRDEIKDQAGTLNWDRYELAREVAAGGGADMDDPKFYDGRTEEWQRRQDAGHAAYEALQDADTSYFRLNISGMSRYGDLMWKFRMEFDAGNPPEWPKMEDYGVTDEMYESATSDAILTAEGTWIYPSDSEWHTLTEDEAAKTAAYIKVHDAVLSWHGDGEGIPSHKFGTNDGWIVTPDECRQAVAAWRAACRETGDGDEELGRAALLAVLDENQCNSEYWLKWLAWIDRATEFGGFAVR